MTELEKLRRQKEEYEDEIQRLEEEVDRQDDIISDLMDELDELKAEAHEFNGISKTTLTDEMKLEKLALNWDIITLEDIDAICRY